MPYARAWRSGGRFARTSPKLADEGGLSIVEVMVAIVLLVVGVLGAIIMINTASGTTLANEARTGGVNLAREVAEGARGIQEDVPYASLTDGCAQPSSPADPCAATSSIVVALQALPGLAPAADAPSGSWVVEREGIDYSIGVSVCSMDDPGDGAGDHDDGSYCADAATGGAVDTDPDDYKRVVVDVSWSGTRGSQSTRAVALLRADGADGPAVSCLGLSGGDCPPAEAITITDGSTDSVSFTAKVNGYATQLAWYVDGTLVDTGNPTGGSVDFTWELGEVGSPGAVVDGSYEISATAFDANGESGTSSSAQVQLNRRAPVAPGKFLAGRDTVVLGNGDIGAVDLEWLPIPDKDVLFYRIYRDDGVQVEKVADTDGSGSTSYTDKEVPANPSAWTEPCSDPREQSASPLRYYVVAVDHLGGEEREGAATAKIDVNACNTPPYDPPANALSIAANPDGTLTLTGLLPAQPGDDDAGDRVSGVRIYRWAGAEVPRSSGDRVEYQSVGPSATTFTYTDTAPRPGGVVQSYCFTTVDERLQESMCSNPVSG